jgi:hypothetical protein
MPASNLLRKRQSGGDALSPEASQLSEKEVKHASHPPSVASSEYTEYTDAGDISAFRPTKSFHVNARGIGAIRLPLPSSELEILVHNADGSLAYISTRNSKCSGNAILSDAATGTPLIASEYSFGPGRDPKMRILNGDDEVESAVTVSGKWGSRDQVFTCDSVPATFRWRYRKEKLSEDDKKKHTVLTMEVEGSKGETAQRLAQLVRTDDTRTPGSSRSSAGNGGVLMIDELAMKLMGISEELAVATALMMLKKEIDRRRAVQFAVLAAAAH